MYYINSGYISLVVVIFVKIKNNNKMEVSCLPYVFTKNMSVVMIYGLF